MMNGMTSGWISLSPYICLLYTFTKNMMKNTENNKKCFVKYSLGSPHRMYGALKMFSENCFCFRSFFLQVDASVLQAMR